MANTCLTELIFVPDGCNSPAADQTSLADLQGFDIYEADNITTSTDNSGVDVMNKAVNRAAGKITREFRSYLDGRGTFNSTLGKGTVGYFDKNQESDQANTGFYRGVEIEVNTYPYVKLTIGTCQAFLKQPGATNLWVIDLLQGKIVDTISFTAVANEIVNVEVNKTYYSNGQEMHYLIALDGDLDAVETYINPIGRCDSSTRGNVGPFLFVNSAKLDKSGNLNDRQLNGRGYTGGLSINMHLDCDDAGWMCQYRSRLSGAMLYATGVELMDELLFSKRVNSTTTIDIEDAQDRRNLYAQYYKNEMDNLLKNLAIKDDACYSCVQRIANRVSIP
jgi:hypothetical protein